MLTHVKVIAWAHIVLGGLMAGGAVLLLIVFGGLAGLIGASGEPNAGLAAPILGGIGGLIFIVLVLLALPGIVAGIGLLQFAPWARILTIVLSALHLLNVPLGTALGIYGLWAMTKRETAELFERPPRQTAAY
jgi:hypothetical protein